MRVMIGDRLEAEYWPVVGAAIAAVVCHPHPLHGGTMHSHVVFRIADACRKRGVSSLRFNFRGVGGSAGVYDRGQGEEEDVTAALDFLAEHEPLATLWVAGFSFGAAVGAKVGAEDRRVKALLLVGAPISDWPLNFLAQVAKPKAFVSGENDEFGAGLPGFVADLPEPRRLWLVPGATHLFDSPSHLDPLSARKDLEACLSEGLSYLETAMPREFRTP